MVKKELVDLLVDKGWEWADHTEQGVPGVAFRKICNGEEVKYYLSDDGIGRATKGEVAKQIGSHDVYHMSRVVGYFARVGNWNSSKLGELKDRQAGNYKI